MMVEQLWCTDAAPCLLSKRITGFTARMVFLQEIWLDQADAAAVSEGEEVTLMDWGNAIIRSIQRDASSGAVTAIDAGGRGPVVMLLARLGLATASRRGWRGGSWEVFN